MWNWKPSLNLLAASDADCRRRCLLSPPVLQPLGHIGLWKVSLQEAHVGRPVEEYGTRVIGGFWRLQRPGRGFDPRLLRDAAPSRLRVGHLSVCAWGLGPMFPFGNGPGDGPASRVTIS